MPRNSSGEYIRTDGVRSGRDVFEQQRAAGVTINAPEMDTHANDMADAITGSIAADGQTPVTADLPLNSHRITGLADATGAQDAATWGQVQRSSVPFVGAAGVGGTADAITLTPSPSIAAYAVGTSYRFITEAANTGVVTLAVSGLAPASMRKPDGTEFAAGDLASGRHVVVVYDGTKFLSDAGGAGAGVDTAAVNALIAAASLNAERLQSGTAPQGRLATGTPGTGKVPMSGSGGTAAWTDPFSVSEPAMWLESGDAKAVVRFTLPRSQSAIQSRSVRYRITGSTGAWTTVSATGSPHDLTGLVNGTSYDVQVRAANVEGSCLWSAAQSVTPQAKPHVVSSAGTTTFLWPWAQSSAYVFLQGGGGGGGGAGEYGVAHHGGSPGAAGSASSVTVGSTTVTASGGGAGRGALVERNDWQRLSGGNGGQGGQGAPGESFGEAGRSGIVEHQLLSGLSVGTSITIVSGAGGAGGAGYGTFPSGVAGGDGLIIITPV